MTDALCITTPLCLCLLVIAFEHSFSLECILKAREEYKEVPNKIALEATVELIDHNGLLVAEGNEATSKARPPTTKYHPVIAEPPM